MPDHESLMDELGLKLDADAVARSGTRDAAIADAIRLTEKHVEALAESLEKLSDHARSYQAEGHARLYEHVQSHLTAAAKDLHRAHAIMANGDAADYSEEV